MLAWQKCLNFYTFEQHDNFSNTDNFVLHFIFHFNNSYTFFNPFSFHLTEKMQKPQCNFDQQTDHETAFSLIENTQYCKFIGHCCILSK